MTRRTLLACILLLLPAPAEARRVKQAAPPALPTRETARPRTALRTRHYPSGQKTGDVK